MLVFKLNAVSNFYYLFLLNLSSNFVKKIWCSLIFNLNLLLIIFFLKNDQFIQNSLQTMWNKLAPICDGALSPSLWNGFHLNCEKMKLQNLPSNCVISARKMEFHSAQFPNSPQVSLSLSVYIFITTSICTYCLVGFCSSTVAG